MLAAPGGAWDAGASRCGNDGNATLYSAGDAAGNASLHERRDTYFIDQSFSPVTVPQVAIDSVIAKYAIATVDFMKMDIEGHELFALRGAQHSIEAGTIRALSFEFGSGNINSRTFFRDYWDLLTGHGYRLHRVLPGGRLLETERYSEELEYFRGVSNYISCLPDRSS